MVKKTRMSIDDIHAMVGSIRKNVLNMRVTNIYDLPSSSGGLSKTYIFKLHQPPFPKVFLLLESGVRFHTSKYARDSSSSPSAATALPSQFTMKLRKHLRGKRLVALTQLEGDRVVDLTFGSDQLQCHLILELYASGNIILTDERYAILSLLRTHKFDENVKMAVKQLYPIEVLDNKCDAAAAPVTTAAELVAALGRAFQAADDRAAAAAIASASSGKTAKKPKVQTLKQLLLTKETTFGGLGPVIVEHCLVNAGLSPSLKLKNVTDVQALGTAALEKLVTELQRGWELLEKLQNEQNAAIVDTTDAAVASASSSPTNKCGFIILKDQSDAIATAISTTTTSPPVQYEEFTPLLYAQHATAFANQRVVAFDTFDEAVDEYFSRFEAEVADVAKHAAQVAAASKLAKLRKNQKTQLDSLLQVQAQSYKHARLLEFYQQDVENVLLVIRSAVASGMDWRGLKELIKFEQHNGNPIASLIHELDLVNNRVSVLLCDVDDDEDEKTEFNEDNDDEEDAAGEDEQDKQAHVVWIDLSLSALANAREIYTKKKRAGVKVQKATDATQKAIDAAEKSTLKTLAKQQTKRHAIYERRKVLWFEKFYWFLSNENFLVLGGKDAQQNELLVKRYLRKGDVYVHADLHGAATCIVRNRQADQPIPVATLEQAACMSVCRSNAWSNQVIAGAYWVHADQVSKTAPAGEYLSTGSFMIRGKKNFIQPSRLEMGLAIVFRLDASSIVNHRVESEDDSSKIKRVEEVNDDERDEKDERVVDVEEEKEDGEDDKATDAQDDKATDTQDDNATTDNVAPAPVAPTNVSTTAADVVDISRVDDTADTEAAADDNIDNATATAPAPAALNGERPEGGRKHLSAKERRDLKKGKAPGGAAIADKDAPSTAPAPVAVVSKKPAATAAVDTTKNVRGKKGKLKKLKKKYADQDDDERRLRMEALGHAVAAVDEQDDDDDNNKDAAADATAPGNSANKAAPSHAVDDAYIQQQRAKKEKFLDEQEEEVEAADFFDAFTGAPLPHDIVMYALPMCAPYASLQKCTYKVKLLPGTQKKGKAAKQAIEYFFASIVKFEKDAAKQRATVKSGQHASAAARQQQDGSNTTDDASNATTTTTTTEDDAAAAMLSPDVDPLVVQRELLKCIPENELVNCMVGPVKISAPGIHGASASGGGKKGGGAKKPKSKK